MGINTVNIQAGTLPYPDIQNGTAMDDFIFDDNNNALLIKLNEAVARINNIIGSVQSSVTGDSGADQIKASTITGVDTTSIQTALESLKSDINNLVFNNLPSASITMDKLNFTPIVTQSGFNQDDIANIQSNYIKTVNPTASENSTAGYKIGDIWSNTSTKKYFRCITDGVWVDYNDTSAATAGLYGQTSISTDDALQLAIPLMSYMMFCTTTNTTYLDMAFGKGNVDRILGIGLQIAMYAYFEGDSSASYPFTVLKKQKTLDAALSIAYNEIRSNLNIINLISLSPFATLTAKDIIPMPGAYICSQSSGSHALLSTGVTGTVQTLTVNRSGRYRIFFSCYSTGAVTLKLNGTTLMTKTLNEGLWHDDSFVIANDVITITTSATHGIVSPIVLGTLKPIIYPTTPTAGTRIIQFVGSSVFKEGAGTLATFSGVPNAGVYRLKFGLILSADDHKTASVNVNVNGSTVHTATLKSTDSMPQESATLQSFDLTLSANAVVTIVYVDGGGSDTFCIFAGATLGINATDNFIA